MDSQAHRELPGNVEPANLSVNNLSRETGRMRFGKQRLSPKAATRANNGAKTPTTNARPQYKQTGAELEGNLMSPKIKTPSKTYYK